MGVLNNVIINLQRNNHYTEAIDSTSTLPGFVLTLSQYNRFHPIAQGPPILLQMIISKLEQTYLTLVNAMTQNTYI